ncbi:hypothetical protein DYBT9275_03192 [Dyadobacter sp. CECT 9275]|uniref:Lipoprotein n=1 Tax=Dyadobacter helix TaxID=2822344 RepID=A0A916JEG1_9BACT|nr:hypothetical protein [Dyadobacter sp. CECT 9275]CAG5003614.1 hypothetical protein DYBT9275_03192 [Dyadobacter sp. CECT 9275]
MKRLLLGIMLVSTISACNNSSVDKKDPNEIYYKETVSINDVPRSTLTFFEVEDSRCPEGVQCIWAGNATVDLALSGVTTEGGVTKHVTMCLGDCHTISPTTGFQVTDTLDENFAGQKYRFILESVNPKARLDSTRKKQDYSIVLKIEKR